MRIGIVTIFNVHNYGAMLQCWSLCNAIKRAGHEPVLIHIPFPNETYSITQKIKNKLQYAFKRDFVSKNLPYTENLKTEVDAYIVGSDQVWNPFIVGSQLDKFLLSFTEEEKPRASYASSFGLTTWPVSQNKELIKKLFQRFEKITVREVSGKNLLKTDFGIEADEVLDPSFLTEDYSSLYVEDEQPSDIVFFKLRPWKSHQGRYAAYEARKRGFSFFDLSGHRFIPFIDKSIKGYNEDYYPVSTWLQKISSANFVLTDSFHGMVFSLIFKKQFVVINSNPKAITRMESLLSKLNLKHRIVQDIEESYKIIDDDFIDYKIVDQTLNKLKQKSQEKLTEILNLLSYND